MNYFKFDFNKVIATSNECQEIRRSRLFVKKKEHIIQYMFYLFYNLLFNLIFLMSNLCKFCSNSNKKILSSRE